MSEQGSSSVHQELQEPHTNWTVVGGGILGLVSALAGLRAGRTVTVLESTSTFGGLTASQQLDTPRGPVECDRYYHVILESDRKVLALLEQIGLTGLLRWTDAPAVISTRGRQFPATSIADLASLPAFSLTDRVRVAASIGASILLPDAVADRMTAHDWLRLTAGASGSAQVWEPLLRVKLGAASSEASARFISSTLRRLVRARLAGDGDRFGVIRGGYAPLVAALRGEVVRLGGQCLSDVHVDGVDGLLRGPGRPRVTLRAKDGRVFTSDRAVLTAPGPVVSRMAPGLRPEEHRSLTAQPHLGVICTTLLVPDAPNDAYITYLIDDTALTGIIGMHALQDPKENHGLRLIYVPRYAPPNDPWFDLSDAQVYDAICTELARLLPDYELKPEAWAVHRARYVMPIPTPGGPPALPTTTSIPGVNVISAAQNLSGTLNVEATLTLAGRALNEILGDGSP